MTNSRRVFVGIAAAAAALALVVIGPAETALGARFPFGGGLGVRQGQHDGQDGQDGKDGRSFNGRGGQGLQGLQGDSGDQRQLNGADGENGKKEDLTRPLSPAQRARLQAREAIARAREQAANF